MPFAQHIRRNVTTSTFLVAALALGACKSNDSAAQSTDVAAAPRAGQAQISESFKAKAEVTALDHAQRLITLRREDGQLIQLKATNEVRNFDQIAVGDQLRVQYKATLTASLRPAGEPAKSVEGVAAAGRAEAGAKPAGGAGIAMAVRVKIESIDREHDLVVFSLASGELVTHRIATPEGRQFVAGLKTGDTVQLTYTEAVALSVEKL
jgi:hypothetical protein